MSANRPHLPLFHERSVRDRLSKHVFSPALLAGHSIIQKWVVALRTGALDDVSERNLQGEFLQRVFGDVLGYGVMSQAPTSGWELMAERTVGSRGLACDGALGFFSRGTPANIIAPIELKGARHSLDLARGRERTPVEQGWNYANHTPGCRYIIVSNFRETRLYSTARTPEAYEVFFLEELSNQDAFKRFLFLLSRDTLLPPTPQGRSVVDELLAASAHAQKKVTDILYSEYRRLRIDLFAELRRECPDRPAAELLASAQTILDRILFIAFAEDRGLLPERTIADAFEQRDRYSNGPVWRNFQTVFRWIDEGNLHQRFPPYNGGLFRADPKVDTLMVSDAICERFKNLATYRFNDEVSVEVLGHIFEQSISDLEELRAEAEEGGATPTPSKRKVEGVFYTPSTVTRFIVEETLGKVLKEREDAAFEGKSMRGKANQVRAWEAYRDALKDLRILDPACGSGAFLIAAFDLLANEYERVNVALAELRGGQIELFDLTKTVLNNNLFGVDLNGESVEITKLSLWLKTAQQGKKLTYLDRNIKAGNSIVEDPRVDRRAFDWKRGRVARERLEGGEEAESAKEIDAHWQEGFDIVIGNPPYVRQELLTPIKEHLKNRYSAYHGMADLFVYFFERGLSVLKPGGRLGFVVSNKWLKGEYAAPLRQLLAKQAQLERIIDFGHAPIFPDADAFPSIITFRKPDGTVPKESTFEATVFPREELETTSVREYVTQNSQGASQDSLGEAQWSLESPGIQRLMQRMRDRGTPLASYLGAKPLYGLKTGFNEAFLLDDEARERLVKADPRSRDLFKKYLRGQDIQRWTSEWDGLWMLVMKSSGDHKWPWAGQDERKAEATFRSAFPALYDHFKQHEEKLRARADQGAYWWELRSCAYYAEFERPKVMYQEIQFHSQYALDTEGTLSNNKCFFLPSNDLWLLAVLNSPLLWWFNWRYLGHMKDEALNPAGVKMEALPIAEPSSAARKQAEELVPRLIELTRASQGATVALLDSLRLQYGVEKAGQKLGDFAELGTDDFIKEVLARRPRGGSALRPAQVADLRSVHAEEAEAMRRRRAEMLGLERRLATLVMEAYKLSAADVRLMWETAPLRMPLEQF